MSSTKKFSIFDSLKSIKSEEIQLYAGRASESTISDDVEYIHTGNYLLNAQISGSLFGGYTSNVITLIAGPSQTGKTYLALNGVREALRMGYKAIWIDSEQALQPPSGFSRFGINPDDVLYYREQNIFLVKQLLVNIMDDALKAKSNDESIERCIIIIDSIGFLQTNRSLINSSSGSVAKDYTRPSEIKDMFGAIMIKAAKLNWPILIVGHTYTDHQSYGAPQKVAGGNGIELAPTVIIKLSKAKLTEGTEKEKKGIIVTSKLEKTRNTEDNKPIKFTIRFDEGMNPYRGLENFVDWETCGIGRGKYVEELIPDLDDDGNQKVGRGGKLKTKPSGTYTFVPDEKAKTIVVKHLNREVKPSEFFTPEVFTKEVMEALDHKMKEIFLLKNYDWSSVTKYSTSDITEFLDDDDNSETDMSTPRIFNFGEQ